MRWTPTQIIITRGGLVNLPIIPDLGSNKGDATSGALRTHRISSGSRKVQPSDVGNCSRSSKITGRP
jgi:hypothetical protein